MQNSRFVYVHNLFGKLFFFFLNKSLDLEIINMQKYQNLFRDFFYSNFYFQILVVTSYFRLFP